MPYAQRVLNVFLPAGFPASVTEDYVGFVSFSLRSGSCGESITWFDCFKFASPHGGPTCDGSRL